MVYRYHTSTIKFVSVKIQRKPTVMYSSPLLSHPSKSSQFTTGTETNAQTREYNALKSRDGDNSPTSNYRNLFIRPQIINRKCRIKGVFKWTKALCRCHCHSNLYSGQNQMRVNSQFLILFPNSPEPMLSAHVFAHLSTVNKFVPG